MRMGVQGRLLWLPLVRISSPSLIYCTRLKAVMQTIVGYSGPFVKSARFVKTHIKHRYKIRHLLICSNRSCLFSGHYRAIDILTGMRMIRSSFVASYEDVFENFSLKISQEDIEKTYGGLPSHESFYSTNPRYTYFHLFLRSSNLASILGSTSKL